MVRKVHVCSLAVADLGSSLDFACVQAAFIETFFIIDCNEFLDHASFTEFILLFCALVQKCLIIEVDKISELQRLRLKPESVFDNLHIGLTKRGHPLRAKACRHQSSHQAAERRSHHRSLLLRVACAQEVHVQVSRQHLRLRGSQLQQVARKASLGRAPALHLSHVLFQWCSVWSLSSSAQGNSWSNPCTYRTQQRPSSSLCP